jgi:predicted ABC-type ATPase
MPEAILIAGPNCAGKTTFARHVLRVWYRRTAFLNADEIQHEASRFGHPIAAGREVLNRIQRVEAEGASFAVESTLSSTLYVRRLSKWSHLGYRTTLHFIELPSADYAIERVARRVDAGGHAIPEPELRRRFERGLRRFHTVYKPLPDRWYDWLSDEGGLHLVDQNETDADQQGLEALLEAARRATWDALHGHRHLRSGRFRPEAADEDHGSSKPAEAGSREALPPGPHTT